ncbi:hypothetical protein ACO0RG_001613 [Hanseniaspora osmophila]
MVKITRALLQEHVTKTKFRHAMQRVANQAMILTTCATTSPITEGDFRGVTLSSVTSLALHPSPMMQFNLQVPSFTSEALHRSSYFAIHLMRPDSASVELAKLFSKGCVVQSYIESHLNMIRKDIKESGGLKKFFSKIEQRNDIIGTLNKKSAQEISQNSDQPTDVSTPVVKKRFLPFKPFTILKPTDYTVYPISVTKLPLLNNCDRVFICKAAQNFRVGDHEIWVAEVQDILSGEELRKEHVNIIENTETEDEVLKNIGGLVYCNKEFKTVGTIIE